LQTQATKLRFEGEASTGAEYVVMYWRVGCVPTVGGVIDECGE